MFLTIDSSIWLIIYMLTLLCYWSSLHRFFYLIASLPVDCSVCLTLSLSLSIYLYIYIYILVLLFGCFSLLILLFDLIWFFFILVLSLSLIVGSLFYAFFSLVASLCDDFSVVVVSYMIVTQFDFSSSLVIILVGLVYFHV